jgi:acyl-CoA reductase-like NAD-dependent aldehyde dehydrogenase
LPADDRVVEKAVGRATARRRKSWRELPAQQKAALVFAAVAEIGMAAGAWADLVRRPAGQVRGPKWRWALLIAVNFVGPIAYFRWGRVRRSPAQRQDVTAD